MKAMQNILGHISLVSSSRSCFGGISFMSFEYNVR